MRIVVTAPTGHIGSKLTNILLDRGGEVTLIARHPDKVSNFKSRGARVIAGEHDDARVLEQAVKEANALFWLTPPNMASHDPLGVARHFADIGARAIAKHPDLFVVQLSSVGAHLPDGNGPIAGLHATEERFRAEGENVTSLRPNFFMENTLSSLPTIVSDGAIYSNVKGSTTAEQIATQDIAEFAAERLLSPKKGHHILDIAGPQDISFEQSTRILGNAIGKPLRFVTIPGEALKQALMQAGFTLEMAELFVEMEEALGAGLAHQYRGEEKLIGHTTLEQFAKNVFAPAYQQTGKVAKAS